LKLLRLDLLVFGPFTGVTLELEHGSEGLHLIYGPNEAGKSSALRALRQVFYAIPERTSDAFRHPYDRLRIGAKVLHSDGSQLEFIRRKARINPLRSTDDRTVIDPQELARFIGDLDQGMFEAMFGIDHETLVNEGKNIVKGGGQVGPILFAAGSGIAHLRDLQSGLQAEMDELFKPAGRNQKINKAIHDLREAEASVKRHQLSSDEWLRHDRALSDAQQHKAHLEEELGQLRRKQQRLTRIRDALPGIAERKALLAGLETYRHVMLLPADFGEKRRESLVSLHVAEDQAQRARDALEKIDQQLHELDVPEGLLEQADRIEELHRRLGEYENKITDRPVRDLQRRTLEHEAKEILRSLGKPAELEASEQLRLRADEPIRIQNLGNQYQGLTANLNNAQQTANGIRKRIREAEEEAGTLELPQDPEELRRIVRQIQRQGALEEQLQAKRDELEQTAKQAAIELRRMTLWSGTLEGLEQLRVPSPETMDRFEGERNAIENTLERLAERKSEEETEVGKLDREIARLELEHEVPSEEDLKEARRQRDAGWKLVRRSWIEGDQESKDLAMFLKAFEPAKDLGEAYERSVERADHVSDRLRWEADRVANKANLVVDRNNHSRQRDKLARDLEEAEADFERLRQEWHALWQPMGIKPLKVQEMRGWLGKQADLARQAQLVRDGRSLEERLQERIDAHRSQLQKCLQKLGEPTADPDESLVLLLERSQEVVDRFEGIKNRRELLQGEISKRK
jgi:uncharacterized protein YhaN